MVRSSAVREKPRRWSFHHTGKIPPKATQFLSQGMLPTGRQHPTNRWPSKEGGWSRPRTGRHARHHSGSWKRGQGPYGQRDLPIRRPSGGQWDHPGRRIQSRSGWRNHQFPRTRCRSSSPGTKTGCSSWWLVQRSCRTLTCCQEISRTQIRNCKGECVGNFPDVPPGLVGGDDAVVDLGIPIRRSVVVSYRPVGPFAGSFPARREDGGSRRRRLTPSSSRSSVF